MGWSGRTFGVDVLADTGHSPVLDRSVTTVDVEDGALEKHGAAAEEHESGKTTAQTLGSAAGKAAAREAAAATAGPSRGPDLVGVFLKWAAIRHVDWWWAIG